MNWLVRQSVSIQALCALATALVALVALVAIPWQLRATVTLQAEQSARDIYREFVALSVSKPEFSAPDYCVLSQNTRSLTAYSYYIEYLLYTAEQVTGASEEWTPLMQSHLSWHAASICDNPDW